MATADALVKLANSTMVVSMLQTCALTILVWDWIITIGLEVKYVWPSKWTLGKVLFFMTRYLPVIDAVVCLSLSQVALGNSSVYCPTHFHAETWFLTTGMHVAEFILVLRTWAICDRNRAILVGLLLFQAAIFVYNGAALEVFFRSIVWAGPEFTGIPGCFMKSASGKIFFSVTFINIAILESFIFITTMIACIRKDRRKSHLVEIIWRDGLIFFLLIGVVSVFNVVIMFTVPPTYWFVLTPFQLVMHSVATSRILLHMREEAGTDRCIWHTENGNPVKTIITSNEAFSPIQFCERDGGALTSWIGGGEEREEQILLGSRDIP
ncbi:hypothetical protein DL96DRAFT_1824255 [Flagelloscypha sp. PMI_526]|nr:hypothetical protein DL96DRAFT_1824255 [Flagelloscypha sp. PMI_526]